MNVLHEIKDLYDRDGKIGEDPYKQRIFLDFFKELGYEKNEIRFEDLIRESIYDTDKFVDVLCGDILLEVKSSNKALNKDVLRQAFQYNQGVGKNIVGVTNFKKFEFYDKSVNNLILEFDINNYENKLHDIYRILGKHTFSSEQIYFQYHERMDRLNGLLKDLKEYLEAYKSSNYEILPHTEEDNRIFSTITRNLHNIKYFNANLDSNMEQIINELSDTCENLDNLMALNYFSYDSKGRTILGFKENWLRYNSLDKIETVQNIENYVQNIKILQEQITQLDNIINNWNSYIYNLNDYYERQAEFY